MRTRISIIAAAILMTGVTSLFGNTPAQAAVLGTELLANGDMESEAGWAGIPIGSQTIPGTAIVTAERHSGNSSLHSVIVRGTQEWPAVRSAAFATESGKTYRVSFWIKVVKGQARISMRNGADNDYSNFYSTYFSIPQWTRYTCDYREQKGGANAYLFFSATGSEAEFYLDDVSVRELDNSVEAVRREWQKVFPAARSVCWQKTSPWASLAKLQSPPEGVRECKQIRASMGRNEYETASFVLTNLDTTEQNFQISVDGKGVPVTLRHSFWVTAKNGNKVDDALPLLEGKLHIPPGESREVWLTLHSQNLKAGQYNSTIKIEAAGIQPRTLALATRVYPVTLPEDKPLYTYYWDHIVPSWTTPARTRALMLDMKQHYVNVNITHPWSTPRLQVDATGKLINDYTELDQFLDSSKVLKPKMIVFFWSREDYFNKQVWKDKPTQNAALPPYMSEAWKVLFKEWLKNWVQHMKARGYGYDKFAMNPDDENLLPASYEMVKLIKETDPRILILVNSFGANATESQRIAPYVDIFCPFLYDHLNMPPYDAPELARIKPAATKLLKKSDEYYWTYTNPLTNEPQEAPSYQDYRLAVWRTWAQGMRGFGYWVYSYKTHWDYTNNPDGPNWAVVYFADDPDAPAGLGKEELVVPSKRWEATREGVEDYVYLFMLKSAVAKAGKSTDKQALQWAHRLLAEMPKKVLSSPDNEELASQAKEFILQALSRISPSK